MGPGGSRLRELEDLTKRNFFFVGLEDVHLDHFRVLDRGDVARLGPKAPVEVGQELELKLGEVGLHDPHAGVGKVKGFDVVVAGAAKLVGKKVKVRVGAVMEGSAYAEPVGVDDAEGPITAEAEAEKPTRARKGDAEKVEPPKKPAQRKRAAPAVEAAEPEAEEEEPEAEPEVEAEAGEAAAVKKKTRRGTRGGRNRKKKTAPSPVSANGDEPESVLEEGEEAPAAPVIHLPGRELDAAEPSENGDQPAAPRKRPTRRGSRGGRNRKKKTGTAASPATEPEAEASATEESEGPRDWEYTPMSEWGHE
jgi:predicted RNA-binding protein with TRAM domain